MAFKSKASAWRLLFPLMIGASAVGPALAGPNPSNSSQIPTAFEARYGVTPSCETCHGANSAARPNDPDGNGTVYGRALDTGMNFALDASGNSISNSTTLTNGLDIAETLFAPFVSRVNGSAFTGNLITLPGNQTSLSVTLDPGKNFDGNGSEDDLKILGASSTPSSLSSSLPVATSISVSLSSLSPDARGSARRSAVPFNLSFSPVNSTGFRNTSAANIARNRISFTFQNIGPTGNADPAQFPDATNSAVNPLAVSILSNDIDPDGPENAMTVVLVSGLTGVDPGTLTLNPSGTGFFYAVPAVLQALPRQTTFSYAPVDGEGLQGTTVSVTINIPASGAPVDPPVAADDAFTFTEGTVLTGDVRLDNGSGVDSDPNGLGTVTFKVLNPPARGILNFAPAGTFTYTPVLNDTGVQTFQYEASDGTGSDSAIVTLTISPDNDPPTVTAVTLAPRNVSEAAFPVNLVGPEFAADIDGDTLTASSIAVSIVLNETDSTPVIFDQADVVSISGSTITFSPTALGALDDDESADITVTYLVSDGFSVPVGNTATLRILGLDSGLGRIAGLYADQISSRYNGHFGGTNQANGSCHTCHLPGRVDADVDSVDECVQSPPVFNTYGLNLCLNRDANTPALADLRRRMAEAEPEFAPRLQSTPRFVIDETLVPGDAIGAPLPVASRGKTVDGGASDILEYLIVSGGVLSNTDESGLFTVDTSGQMRVAPGATLVPDVYSFVVLPVNDAGQKDNAGNLRPGVRGFFPFETSLQTTYTVEVGAVPPETVADTATTLSSLPITVAVTGNDLGGTATVLTIATSPANGTVVVNGNFSVTYTPATGFAGTDSFSYTTANAAGTSAAATVTITVLADGNVVARDDAATTLSGIPITIGVLANDLGAVTSGNGQTRVAILSAPDAATVGSLTLSGQSLVFTPVAGFVGETRARYSAVNPTGTATEADVRISVIEAGTTAISDALADPELKKVAQAFEQSCPLGTDPAFLAACANLTAAATNGENLEEAMRALRNEEHLAAVDTAFTLARNLGRGLQDRIGVMRNGAVRGFDISGLNLTIGGESIPMRLVTDIFNGALGLSEGDGFDDPAWGVFVAGDISVSEKDATSTAEAFEIISGNMLVGLDYELGSRSSLGFALGYSSAETDFSGSGSLGADAVQASVYGRLDDAIGRGIDFDGYFSIGQVDYDSDRRILFTSNGITVDGLARADFDGVYVNIVPTLSFSEQLGRYGDPLGELRTGTELRWRAGLDYLKLNIDGYSETGGAGLALSTQSETYESLVVFFGVDARRPIWVSARAASEIRGGITLRSELLDDSRSVTSSFVAAGPGAPSFSVVEEGSQGFGGTLDLGITLDLEPGQIAMDYSFDFSSDGLRTHSVAIGYSRSFGRLGTVTTGVRGNVTGDQELAAEAEVRYYMAF